MTYHQEYYLKNKESISKKRKEYVLKNKEEIARKRRQHYLANKEMVAEQNKKYRQENKEVLREYDKKYRQENKEKIHKRYQLNKTRHLLYQIKSRAKLKGYPFNLQPEDILPPNICPILNIPLERGDGKRQINSPSVDRIIPELGYVRGNIQIISYKANLMKNDATPEELVLFAKWVQRTYPEMF